MTKKKNKRYPLLLDEELFEEANAMAKAQGRSLAGVLRSFLRLWTTNEYPEGFDPAPRMPDEGKRATRSDKGKKRK